METKYGYSAADWGKIRTLQFGILSPEQIRAMSAVQIVYPEAYEHGQPKMGGLNDPRMGTVDKSLDCSTCASTMVQCPGHFGHLELAKPMFHVGFLKTVLSVLRCICINCSAILADEILDSHIPPMKQCVPK